MESYLQQKGMLQNGNCCLAGYVVMKVRVFHIMEGVTYFINMFSSVDELNISSINIMVYLSQF